MADDDITKGWKSWTVIRQAPIEAQAETVQELAREAGQWLEGRTRADGSQYRTLKDGRPEWVQELVREAHGDFLPDDWRYNAIEDALQWIADEGEDEDPGAFADANTDVYTDELGAWLNSSIRRGGFVDEAIEEYGWPDDRGIAGALAMGQYVELCEVYYLVRTALEARLGDE
jgi:hypothetical protein